MLRYLILVLLLMTSPAHAAWLHACPSSSKAEGAVQAVVIRPDGSESRVFVSDQSSVARCQSTRLPLDASEVAAIKPLPSDAAVGDTVLVHGSALSIGEVSLPSSHPAREPPAPMPLRANLLAQLQVRSFGVEERIHVQASGGRLRISCRAGEKPAGVILTGPWYLPRANLMLRLEFAGSGSFALQVADEQRVRSEEALDVGSIVTGRGMQTVDLKLPSGLDRAGWKQFVIVCPGSEASLELTSIALAPVDGTVPGRSSWIWRAEDWQQRGAEVLDWARQHKVTQLFITIPVQGLKVTDPEALAAFVRLAHERGVAVSSTDGDPHMVIPDQFAAAINRVRAYEAYNAGVEKAARLDGIQFDIEPYLLPGYGSAAERWDWNYLQLVQGLRAAAGQMRLEFVVPFWWANKTGLLRGLADHADGLTVMDYRTARDDIYRFAVPFLDWADRYGKQVRIALEAGPLEAETQRRYVRAAKGEPGELLLVRLGGQPVLALLKTPHAVAGADTFRFAGSREIDGSATTFHARKDALLREAEPLERDFSAWRGFAGIALHELR